MKRQIYIDQLKGFAICLVVLFHTLQCFFDDSNMIVRVIASFFMPLFMFVSGYLSYRVKNWDHMSKRFVQLLVPFFSVIVLTFIVEKYIYLRDVSLIDKYVNVILHPDLGLWFLWALFFISAFFVMARKISTVMRVSQWIVFLVLSAILNLIVVVFNIKLFGFHWIGWYFIYYSVGALFHGYCDTHQRIAKHDNILFYVSIVMFCLLVPFFQMHNEPPTFYRWVNLGAYFPYLYRLVLGFIGVLVFYLLFKIYSNRLPLSLLLQKLGTATLGIYYIHFFILNAIVRFIPPPICE